MDMDLERVLSRRAALGGMGAAVALPLVDSYVGTPSPAGAAFQQARPLQGKVALVTGSGRNLGRDAVLELARRGADVVVNARSNREEVDAVAGEAEALGVRAHAVLADVGDEEQVGRMVEEVLARLGRIDILINNAGFRGTRPFTEMTTAEWREALAVNLDGPFYCARAVVPGMIANGGGRIVNVSGLNAFNGRTNWAHICAGKMGALGMTRALAVELAPHNILVNHVVPGAYDAAPDLARIPMGRLGLGEELARVYGFLASDDSSYLTGQTLHVNGGELRY